MKVGRVSPKEARAIGNKIGLNWKEINIDEYTLGLNMELGSNTQSRTSQCKPDILMTGKIVWAHIKLLPNYYSSLGKWKSPEYMKHKE